VTDERLIRAASPRVLWGANEVFLFGSRGEACALEGEHADLVEAVLEQAAAPLAREELVHHILEKAGADLSQRTAVDEAIDLLFRMGALVSHVSVEARDGMSMVHGASPALPEHGQDQGPRRGPPLARALSVGGAHVLVCCAGAIGVLSAPSLVEGLLAAGQDVRVALTRSARRFITARAFEAITHRPTATSLWEGTATSPAPHVELARWADVVVVYPCTATTLARLAAGDCSELVSATVTTTRAPVLLAPSMNAEMNLAPAVRDNLTELRARGFLVAHPGTGREVADAPRERVTRGGVAPPPIYLLRYVSWLLEREASKSPKLPSRAEWDVEHDMARGADAETIDAEFMRALDTHAAPPARVLDVGAGMGALARAAATQGFVVVATDFSRRAVERAHALDPNAAVTWVVDDATDSSVVGSFDVVLDRACLGCVPERARQRYAATLASLVRPGGVIVLKVHASPARQIRSHGFTREEVLTLFEPWFAPITVRESTLTFRDIHAGAALFFELRRSP
jgi:phosphopantothenoylcysteine decarboxylase